MKRGRKPGHFISEYALYKGDEFLDIGTADFLSKKWDIALKTIYSASSRKAKHSVIATKGGYIFFKLGEDEECQ